MATTASGLFSVPKDRLRTMFSQCSAAQTRWNCTEAQLAARTYRFEVADPAGMATKRPFALIQTDPETGGEALAGGPVYVPRHNVKLWLFIEETANGKDPEASGVDFENFLGAIYDHLWDNAGVDDLLPIQELTLDEAPQLNIPQDRTREAYWRAAFAIGAS